MNLIKRVISAALCAIILFLSPVSVYLSAENISTVHASGEIVVEGASIAWEWLLAWLASVGLTAAAVENKDALMDSYKEYLDAQIDTELTIGEAVSDKCIEIYDSASNAVSSIPWDDYYNSLENFHDTAVDNLTGIYMKVCPELLESFESFIDSIISGDTYIEGISNVIEEQAFTSADYEAQWSGDYNLKAGISWSNTYTNPSSGEVIHSVNRYAFDSIVSDPCAIVYTSIPLKNGDVVIGYQYQIRFYGKDSSGRINLCKVAGTLESFNDKGVHNYGDISMSSVVASEYLSTDYGPITNLNLSWNANIPVFGSYEDAKAYLSGELDYTNAVNFTRSMYDAITDNNDLPFWDVEALWERVARAVDVIDSIGAYGQGVAVGTNDWADDLPWVDVGALSEWDDVIDRTLEGILSGVIDLPLDIPDNPTYVDVWQDVIDKTWDDVITDNPAKTDDPSIPLNPDKPIEDNPDIPIDQPVEEVIELDATLPSMPETFLPLAGQMKTKFPFSIPWDLKYLFDKLSSQGREPPRWVLPFVIESIGLKGELVIDLKDFEPVSKISRLFLTLLFCLGLINMTIKIVGMRKEE